MKYTILSMEALSGVELPDPIVWEPGLTLERNQPYLIGGLVILLEYLAGDKRSGIDGQGQPWESVLPAHYGHILDTVGGDGEELDVYIKDADCDWTADVHVIDQLNLATGNWDEHKCMIGFADAPDAEAAYVDAFSDGKGRDRLGATCTICSDTFLTWVYGGDLQAAMATQDIPDMTVRATKQGTDAVGEQIVKPTLPAVQARFGSFPVTLKGADCLSIIDESNGEQIRYSVYLIGPLLVWDKSRPIVNDLVRLLKMAPSSAEFHIYIASPGGSLFDAMRIASAMRNTKAKVITYAIGQVCSAAVILWAEGHVRQIGRCAYFMQHMSSHGQSGKSTQIMQRAAIIVNYVRNVVLQRQIDVGLWTEEEISDLVDRSRDIYITAAEAIKRTEQKND